jgi:hypothetical protein
MDAIVRHTPNADVVMLRRRRDVEEWVHDTAV